MDHFMRIIMVLMLGNFGEVSGQKITIINNSLNLVKLVNSLKHKDFNLMKSINQWRRKLKLHYMYHLRDMKP